MTSLQNPNLQADQKNGQTQETTPQQAVAPTNTSLEQETHSSTKDHGSLIKDEQVNWDPKTAKFSSPYYDPFGDGEEDEVVAVSPRVRQGVATITAYHPNGAHR